ncbi:MAG: DUF4157 domain-containing protein [Enhygromyxa sp.]
MPKLEVGDVNDPLEREADAVADQVMRMPAPSPEAPHAPASEPAVSTVVEFDQDEADELIEAPPVSGFAGAAALPGGSGAVAQRKCASCEAEEKDDEIHRSVANELFARKYGTCEDENELHRACANCDLEEDEQLRRQPVAGSSGTSAVGIALRPPLPFGEIKLRDQSPHRPIGEPLIFYEVAREMSAPKSNEAIFAPWRATLRRSPAPTQGTVAGPTEQNESVKCSKPPCNRIAEWLVHDRYPTCQDRNQLRRACALREVEGNEPIMREPGAGRRGGATSDSFVEQLRGRARGSGRPLPDHARNFLEPRLGVPLGHLRIHDDSAADSLAERINARAFTFGTHIFFRSGEAKPTTHAGMRLLAHEVAHTLQNAEQGTVERSSADDLVSSMANTAETVLDDVVAGSFYTSNEFEERIRKLSKSERKRLRTMMVSQSFVDQEIVDELIEVLDNVIAGYVGGTVGHVESRPCEPGDVEPVSMPEWTGDLTITDLELLGGSGESKGKLGRHTPSQSLRLFQRALIQWGCQTASPARNPLPTYGADGAYGEEFRRGVRQFQRAEGLSVDGAAGPATIKAMATELYGINLRSEVERELEIDRAREQLEAQQAADAELGAWEDRVDHFIWTLYKEGKRYRKNQSVQYEANVSLLVAQKIQGFGPTIISEGLERVQLQDPDFYEHVLFGGRLISALQELGVFGVEFKAPRDADFLDGFVIESNNLEHDSPLASPQFSGWDIPEIFAGFTIGTGKGIAKGIAETIEGIVSLFTPEFWKAMYDMVPKVISEPNFRFEIGRASAEMLHKQLAALNASKPYDYGKKLGVLFGMLVFEIAVGVLTGGVGSAALKGLDGAKLLSKFPRLKRLAQRIASTSLIRAGVKAGSRLAEGAMAVVERVQKLVGRVRKLLPDLTSNAKLGRQLGEFAEADMLAALATKKELTRKLDELELTQTKLELALDQPEPDYDQVQRLAKDLEQKANALEDLVAARSGGKHRIGSHLRAPNSLKLSNDRVSLAQKQGEIDFIDQNITPVDGHNHVSIEFDEGYASWNIEGPKACRINSPKRCHGVKKDGKLESSEIHGNSLGGRVLNEHILRTYTPEEIADVVAYGKVHGLSEQQVYDFLNVGGIKNRKRRESKGITGEESWDDIRRERPLGPDELKQHMDNWKGEIEPRGYPYLFDDASRFKAFKGEIEALAKQYNLPEGSIVVQGSSLRTPDARDVDVALFVSREDFDRYANKALDHMRPSKNEITRKGTAKTKKFRQLQNHVRKGFIRKSELLPNGNENSVSKVLNVTAAKYKLQKIDFSLMVSDSHFAMYPFLPF